MNLQMLRLINALFLPVLISEVAKRKDLIEKIK